MSAVFKTARDGGKSVRAEVNGSGTVTASFRYRAYGAIAQSNGASTPSYLGYAGQLQDPSGLLYMRARWYDPAVGRFTTSDPAASGSGIQNLYAYASANPIRMSDPTGLFPVDEEGKPLTNWRDWELQVGKQLEAEYPSAGYDIVYNRAVRDPDTGDVITDANGIARRPDFQVFDRSTGDLVHMEEASSGGIPNLLGRKSTQMEGLLDIAAQHPSNPSVGLSYRILPSSLGLASRVLGPLQVFLMYLDFRQQLMNAGPSVTSD